MSEQQPGCADGGAARAARTTVLRTPPAVAAPVAGRYATRARMTRTSTGADA
ncbi:hypothetical protein [Streptomyces echinatus]|uniref:Uncharacterized protein n=1 Tax=Streptomyces echinatus TaxID=67293 RepID=A0A7W9PR15_9ACTN|nr:hypothetical protein [Streptomyces echinatus]MBB5925717.1 hypothetical protein [Streptomyces echinatus]